ncbi:MAG: cadherin-like beta sandwich domain-containing protein, partial [Clostridium sp.]|nr:cadherin-like beta sandwich domain-containing protein [Clostridium sp.]
MKGNKNLKRFLSFLIAFVMIFSFIQFGSLKSASAIEQTQAEGLIFRAGDETGDIIPVDRDPQNTDSLVINNLKVVSQYTLDSTDDYVLTGVEKLSGGDDVTISDPIQSGSDKYRYTISNIQNYSSFKIGVTVKNINTGVSTLYPITINFVSISSLEFGKISVTYSGSKNYTTDLYYGDENDSGEYYQGNIDSGITNADIKMYAKDGKTLMPIKVNGQSNSSVKLEGGRNVIKLTVTSNSISKIYTLVLDKISDARLKSLVPSTGSLSPKFDSDTQEYTLTVPTTTTKISFTPTAADNSSTIKVKKSTVASGKKSAEISLDEGDNKIPITVTNQYGSYTYNIIVTRTELFRSSALTGLRLSSGSLSPAFNKGVTEYSAIVENSVTSVSITPTAEDKNATIKVEGKVVPSGASSSNISLDEGGNTITIVVTDTKDRTTTYTVNVTRRYPKNNVNLSSLTVTDGKISPIFDPETYLYSVKVDRNIDSVRIKFTTQNDKAKVKINGVEYANGQSDKIKLNLGANTVKIEVIAEDGKSTTTYALSIIRDKVEGKYQWVVEGDQWTYYNGYGTKVKNDWVKYDNLWYYMDLNGYRQTGWREIGGVWYFFNTDGIMQTGWMYDKGYWYYLQGNGALRTNGWAMYDGN